MVFRGQDAWRKHPIFRWNFIQAFPGLREGAAAFGVYLILDKFFFSKEDKH
jgi:NADH-ubiquinone oxidoreductase B12 subunit family